jgi:two-component system, chemotaxis family, chemotaxis protein CheY
MPAARVLVVEDQAYLREIVVDILCEFGYPAVGIGDPHEALAEMPRIAPDVIVLDMRMPTMNGRVFIARLRDDPRLADLPVLVVSGDRNFAAEVAAYPRVGFLLKPFEASTLVDLVREFIGPPLTASA